MAAPSASHAAATLWYNGDYDDNDASTNEAKVPINMGGPYVLETSLVFDDFIVPVGQTWTLSSVFSKNQLAYYAAPTTATWQIRSGVSAGNGGTLVASGDTTATATELTPADGNNYIDPEYQISAAVTGVVLTAGTYWMAVAPDSAGYYGDQSYIETTSGANAIGQPPGNDGNSYITNNLTGPGAQNFAVAPDPDYSAGVIGTAVTVPEPASALLMSAGLTAASLLTSRRRGKAYPTISAPPAAHLD